VAEKLGVKLREFDLTAAHRFPSKKGVEPIIIRLHSFDKKEELMLAAKTKKSKGRDVEVNTNLPIYFNDNLSRDTRARWNKVREMVDNGILYSAKCMDGKIKVRELKGDQMKVFGGSPYMHTTHVCGAAFYQKKNICRISTEQDS